MKQNYLLIALLITFGWASAQSTLTIDPCPVDVTGDPSTAIIKGEMNLSHSGAAPITMAWKRITNDLATGWTSAVCDPNLCYGPGSDEPLDGTGALTPFPMPAGGTITGAQFYVQFVTGGNLGSGTVRIKAYDVNDTTNSVICSVNLTVDDATGIESTVVIEESISLYPNPVKSQIQISSSSPEVNIKAVEIYNIVGKRVQVLELPQADRLISMDLSELKEGMYFARIIDSKKQLISSKRFTKVN